MNVHARATAGGGSWVGNDVVDLVWANQPAPHSRFEARVLSAAERARLGRPHGLWAHFAGKEAAYKLFVKACGRALPFSPASFELSQDLSRVETPFGCCKLHVEQRAGRIHATAWLQAGPQVCAVRQLTQRDEESRAARRLAISLAARRLGVASQRLQLRRRADARYFDGAAPPELLLDGTRLALDVSLSHHGRFVAVALGAAALGGQA